MDRLLVVDSFCNRAEFSATKGSPLYFDEGILRVLIVASRETITPITLITDPSLTASAKVIWMVLSWYEVAGVSEKPSISGLARRTGLSRTTVREAVRQLGRSRWRAAVDHLPVGDAGQPINSSAELTAAATTTTTTTAKPRTATRSTDAVAAVTLEAVTSPGVETGVATAVAVTPASPGIPVTPVTPINKSSTKYAVPVAATQASAPPMAESRQSPFLNPVTQVGPAMRVRPVSQTGPAVRMPLELLFDGSLSPQTRVVYGLLQAVPGFRYPSGESTYFNIARLAGKDPRSIKRAIHEMARAGWLEFSQENQRAPICFTLRHPVAEMRRRELARVKRRIERAPYLGEALMREYLTLIVDSEQYEDDAAPGFLVNPLTDERLQFDRYYPPDVAFEFNGPQHYHATDLYSAEEAARQRARDLIKRGLCDEKGIKLIVVHAEDLSFEAMRRKVEGYLPLRQLSDHHEVVQFLDNVSRSYRRRVRRWDRGVDGGTIVVRHAHR